MDKKTGTPGSVESSSLIEETRINKQPEEIKISASKLIETIHLLVYSEEANSELIFLINLKDQVVFANTELLRIINSSENDLYNKRLNFFFTSASLENWKNIIKFVNNGEVVKSELEVVKANGSTALLAVKTSQILDDEGKLIGFENIGHDITEISKLKKDLLNLYPELNQAYTSFPDIFFRIDSSGNILNYISSPGNDLYLPPELFEKKKIFDVLPDKVKPKTIKALNQVKTTKSYVSFEFHLYINNLKKTYETRIIPHNTEEIIILIREITASKKSQIALKKSELRFRSVWENSLDGMRLLNMKGNIVAVNKAYCKLVDKKSEDLIGNPFNIIYKDEKNEDVEAAFSSLNRRLLKGFPSTFEKEVLLHNGKRIFLEVSNSFIDSYEGDVPLFEGEVLLLSIFRDITVRKAYEKELIRLRKAVENSDEIIFTTNKDRIISFINPKFTEIYGYEADEIIGKATPGILRGRLNSKEDKNEYWNSLQNKKTVKNEWFNQTKAGKTIIVEESASPILDEENNIIGFLSIQEDITERKKSEQELLKLRKAVENSGEVIFETDENGIFTFVNPEFTRLYGYTSKEVVNKATPRILKGGYSDPAIYNEFWKSLQQNKVTRVEWINKTKDGRLRTVEGSASSIFNEKGENIGFLAIQRDVTERKQNEEVKFLLASIVESSNDAIIGKSLEGNIVSWNSGAEKIYQYKSVEILGKDITVLIPPDKLDEQNVILAKLASGQTIKQYETIRVRKDGKRINVSLTISPIKDALGRVSGISSIGRDITAKKLAEEELHRREQEFRTLVENSPDLIFRFDKKLRHIYLKSYSGKRNRNF